MSQSLSQVYIHCVFSTKNRVPMISKGIQDDLHKYIVGTATNLGSFVNAIYANPDHIHILCTLPRTITIAELISKIKSSSSKWLKTKGIANFSWQGGYGAFSVSSSKLEIVKRYILNQEVHHAKSSFQDEFKVFLKEYNIGYDEKYIWD